MSKSGCIIIIEDDADDRSFLESAIKKLEMPNALKWFDTAEAAYHYISTTAQSIFLILSDVNLPGKNGLEFKKRVDAVPRLRKKSIPFIFYSTTAHQKDVIEAYTEMTIQGFFKKEHDSSDTLRTMKVIFDYWSLCRHPNVK